MLGVRVGEAVTEGEGVEEGIAVGTTLGDGDAVICGVVSFGKTGTGGGGSGGGGQLLSTEHDTFFTAVSTREETFDMKVGGFSPSL